MKMNELTLVEKMRRKAADPVTSKIRAAALLEHAGRLEKAIKGFYSSPQTVPVGKFVREWALARKLWETISGEDVYI